MNKLFFAMALLFVGMSVNAQHLGSVRKMTAPQTGPHWAISWGTDVL